jgi:chemotaxis protein CheD
MVTGTLAPLSLDKESLTVGMGEIVVSASADTVISCIGLGSCIAVCAQDKLGKIGGMVHVVLPQSNGVTGGNPAKFADTAVPLLLEMMVKKGASRNRLTIKIAGGAQMTVAAGLRDTFKTGERNLAQIRAALEKERIAISAADVGGTLGRTVKMYLGTGLLTVKTVNGTPREL